MPTYEYECEKCCLKFELKRHFGEDGEAPCPQCAGEARRIFSPVPIIFKGSGFYVTDNKQNNPASECSASKTKDDKKPEADQRQEVDNKNTG